MGFIPRTVVIEVHIVWKGWDRAALRKQQVPGRPKPWQSPSSGCKRMRAGQHGLKLNKNNTPSWDVERESSRRELARFGGQG